LKPNLTPLPEGGNGCKSGSGFFGALFGILLTDKNLPFICVLQRHRKRGRKLNKPADQRKALLRALTTELIRHGRISSTLARCKEVRRCADHMIQLSKDGSLHARRQAMGFIYDKQLVHALFEQGAERYAEREGGYTRVLRTMPRKGDNAEMGIIELV